MSRSGCPDLLDPVPRGLAPRPQHDQDDLVPQRVPVAGVLLEVTADRDGPARRHRGWTDMEVNDPGEDPGQVYWLADRGLDAGRGRYPLPVPGIRQLGFEVLDPVCSNDRAHLGAVPSRWHLAERAPRAMRRLRVVHPYRRCALIVLHAGEGVHNAAGSGYDAERTEVLRDL